MTDRYRVLVIAEAANPEWVSVPLVGWSMANALRRVADVHIVTQIRNADALRRAGLVEGRDFTAINSERVARPAYWLANGLRGGAGRGWTMVTAMATITYFYFERLTWRRFGAAIRRGDYDLVHRLTPLSPTTPSPLARKCRRAGIPFVLGPLNGGLPWPRAFNTERRKEREWLSYVRGAYRWLPGRKATLESANVIIAGSRHTAAEIPGHLAQNVVYMPENGIDPARFDCVAQPPEEATLRLCFIGRLVPYKGPDMAIEALLPLLRDGSAHLDIVGDGPMRAELEALVEREQVAFAITFHGWIEHAAVQAIACRSSVFVFPSVREFGGGAVLEAMAMGLVPVVINYGGPGELVHDGRGFAVPLGTRAEIIAGVRAVLLALAGDPQRIADTGASARAWAINCLTWSAKADRMLEIYDWATGARTTQPKPY